MDTYNIVIEKGSSYSLSLTARDEDGVPLNLSDHSGRGMLKFKYSDTGSLVDFSVGMDVPASGELSISLTAAQTAALPVTKGVYDIEAYTSSGIVLKLLKGYAEINPEATS